MNQDVHIGAMLNIVSRVMMQRLDERANKIGLTSVQTHILHYLCKELPVKHYQRDIEQRFELSHATVSGICARLEAKGFIECVPDDNDKRYRIIKLTQRALECNSKMFEGILENEKKLTEGFCPEEIEQIKVLLQRMLNNLDIKLPDFVLQQEEKQC